MESQGELLVGTKIVLGYDDGTSEDFYLTIPLQQAQEIYDEILTSEDWKPYIVIDDANGRHYRKADGVEDVDLSRYTLVDASKIRTRRKPSRSPRKRRTPTTAQKGTTKKA